MNKVVDQALNDAVDCGIFPSAQLLVAKGGLSIFHKAYGNSTLETMFDIASLTKPICSTTLIMQLVAEDILRLDDTVAGHIKEFNDSSKKEITIRHLLNHSSGLPAWQPFYQMIPQKEIGTKSAKNFIIDAICREPLKYKIGGQSEYSDLGFILLGEIIERITKKPLDTLFSDRIATPLKLPNTFFRPLNLVNLADSLNLANFSSTEDCPWRHKVMRGEVHDQNCYAMGGVAGHAGLFSTTSDINKFIAAFVASYKSAGGLIPQEVVERFLPFKNKLTECNSTWLLGWDRPSHVNSQAGSHFSRKSIGHLGYTGCSMWIDLEKDFWVVLLTNRIHPTSTNERIKSFRPTLYNMVYEELIA